jgi:DNA invertase Pin-like site-specific DNA recombinase
MIATLTGREYQRVSKDASGRERSNDEQHDDNVSGCAEENITISTEVVYRDRQRASRSSKAKRHDFNALMADLTGDTFDDDVLVMWENSRGSRRVSEWCALLELLEDRGKLVYVTTHRRRYDPANPRDRRSLLEDAVDAEYESGKSSLRIGRSMRANAEAGARHGGRRAFGYEATGGTLNDDEAAIVRECVAFVLAGRSPRWIAGELNRRGITTTAGNDWHPGPLANMLTGQRIVGMRTHKGRVVCKGQWPAIITEAEHRRVVAALATRSAVGRRGRTPWLLTGLLRCEACGASLSSFQDHKGVKRYRCRKGPGYKGCGAVTIKAEPLEDWLGDKVTQRLVDVQARQQAIGGPDDGDELAELDRIEADRLAVGDSPLSFDSRVVEYAALDRRKADAEKRLAAKTVQVASVDLVLGYDGTLWADMDTEARRRYLTIIDHVTVGVATNRGFNRFDVTRVAEPAWKDI